MTAGDRHLTRHLAIVVMVKLAVLAVLWQAFFHQPREPGRARVAAEATGEHILGIPAPQGENP